MNDTNNEQIMNAGKWIGAAVAGALLMYAFDPERGARRRALARGTLRDARERTGGRLEHALHQAGNRFDSARLRAGDRLAEAAHAAGDRLAEASHRTRERLEHARERLADASYEASEHAHEAAHAARKHARQAAEEIRGKADYAASELRHRADEVSERARERAERAQERFEERTSNLKADVKADARTRAHAAGNQVREWSDQLAQAFGTRGPTLTNSALLGTGVLSVAGLVRRSPVVALLGLGALAVLLRSERGRHLVDALRHRGAASQVEIEKSIHIDAAPKEVFDAWSEVENFPRFMPHVSEVHDLGHRRSHWVARGPGGLEYTWNAVMTEQSRPDRLAWRSEPGSEIEQHGTVTFEPSGNGTLVTVRMTYAPPAGVLGHGIARMLGADPQRQMGEGLERMKQFVERGGAQLAGRQAAPSHALH